MTYGRIRNHIGLSSWDYGAHSRWQSRGAGLSDCWYKIGFRIATEFKTPCSHYGHRLWTAVTISPMEAICWMTLARWQAFTPVCLFASFFSTGMGEDLILTFLQSHRGVWEKRGVKTLRAWKIWTAGNSAVWDLWNWSSREDFHERNSFLSKNH